MMEIRRTSTDGVTIVHLGGEIWGRKGEPEQLRAVIDEIIGEGGKHVVCNLSGVRLISSIGIGMLIGAYKAVTAAGGALALAEPAEPIQPVFRVLKGPVEYFATEDEAIAYVKESTS